MVAPSLNFPLPCYLTISSLSGHVVTQDPHSRLPSISLVPAFIPPSPHPFLWHRAVALPGAWFFVINPGKRNVTKYS